MLENLKPKWERTLKVCEEDAKKRSVFQYREVGCMYLMCLMMACKLGGETNQGLKEELEKARVDEQKRMKYGIVAKLSNVNQLLGTADNPEEKQHEDKTVSDANSQEAEKKDQIEELCLICNKAAIANNQLVYMARVYKDKSICGVIYGDQSKSNTLITTCLHTVHTNCYIEMKK